MATAAPSRANSAATARPMPESPPVMRATLPSSLPAALYAPASKRGFGESSDSSPGDSWCCFGNGGRGSFSGPSFFAALDFATERSFVLAFIETPPCRPQSMHGPCQPRHVVCIGMSVARARSGHYAPRRPMAVDQDVDRVLEARSRVEHGRCTGLLHAVLDRARAHHRHCR